MDSPEGGPLGSTVPSAMFVEMAVDSLKSGDPGAADKRRELLTAAVEAKDPLFVDGYLLGLRTMEVVFAMRGQRL